MTVHGRLKYCTVGFWGPYFKRRYPRVPGDRYIVVSKALVSFSTCGHLGSTMLNMSTWCKFFTSFQLPIVTACHRTFALRGSATLFSPTTNFAQLSMLTFQLPCSTEYLKVGNRRNSAIPLAGNFSCCMKRTLLPGHVTTNVSCDTSSNLRYQQDVHDILHSPL